MPKKKKKIVKVVDIVPIEGVRKKSASSEKTPEEGAFKGLEIFRPREFQHETQLPETFFSERADEEEIEQPKKKRIGSKVRRYTIIGIAIVAIVYLGITKLPKTDIQITMKKNMVSYQESVFVKTAIGKVDAPTKGIPGEIVSKKVNKIFELTPTGQRSGQQKATGKITIYNTYSSTPQVLVATTRFETPEGKIYRLVNRVTVPGSPGSIEADIIADQPGTSYNTDSVNKLTIPGFKGSPKFEKFYGQITSPVNTSAQYATDDDIVKAQQEGEKELRADLMSLIQLQIPAHMKILSGSEEFAVISKKVDSALTARNTMNIALEAEMKVFVIDEKDIHEFIYILAKNADVVDEQSVEKTFTISYGKPTVQYESGIVTVPLDIQASYWKKMNPEEIRTEIAGKREEEVKSIILSKDGVDRLSASFWPFWVSRAPKDINRIRITLQ